MAEYGALENKPKSTVVVATIVGVAILAAAIGWFVYREIASQRAANEVDLSPLGAEYEALAALEPPLAEVDRLATPETPPADFDRALAAAREAVARYKATPRRTGPLPSGRAWPAQFSATERAATTAAEKFGLVKTYLDIREKQKRNKEADPVALDANVRNVAELAREPLAEFTSGLASMRSQRDAGEWTYTAPK